MSRGGMLPPFTEHPFCLKCAHRKAAAKWIPGDERHEPERIERTCYRCGFTWDEDVIDPAEHRWKLNAPKGPPQ